MLASPTPFPYVGSYGLVEHEGFTQLARVVFRRAGEIVVALPLRDGAAGNVTIDPDLLQDATPLSDAEQRELRALDAALCDRRVRTPRQKEMKARRDLLASRERLAPHLRNLLRDAAARAARQKRAA